MTARIPPLPVIPTETVDLAEVAVGGAIRWEANIYRTLANYPTLMSVWLSWGGHVIRCSALSPVLRELVILRTALVAQGHYPLVQHVRIGRSVGIDDDALARLSENPTLAAWDTVTQTALGAVDQLHHHGCLDDQQYTDVTGYHGVNGSFDLIATVAFYRMACWMLNACRTPLDDGQDSVELEPPVRHRDRGAETPLSPRIEPVPLDDWPQELLDDTAGWPRFRGRPELRRAGVYSTLANHPALFRSIGPVMAHLLVDCALTERAREIVIVRSCVHDRGAYPYRQHVTIAARHGVAPTLLDQLTRSCPVIDDPADGALVAAVDELHRENDISDETWALLVEHHGADATMDLVVVAGFYGLVSFLLNTAHTRLEPGEVRLPPRPFDK